MNYTPGPWMQEGSHITGNEGETLAKVFSEYEGDGLLMAAAPEMLEACIRLMDAFHNQENYQTLFLAVAKATTAVEKATGKTWAEIMEEKE